MRKLRVYTPEGGFLLEVPEDARITFGYFNPAAAGGTPGNPWAHDSPGKQTMKTTALRVYHKTGTKEDQIACFLGVTGFRDLVTKRKEQTYNDPM